jgi:hypothetical protein
MNNIARRIVPLVTALALACSDEAGDSSNVGGSAASSDAGASAGGGGAAGSADAGSADAGGDNAGNDPDAAG